MVRGKITKKKLFRSFQTGSYIPMADKTINLLMMTPERKIFEGQVLSISCKNELGNLDILPEHSNFMSMIVEEITIRDLMGKEKKIPVEQAIIQVLKDMVVILMNINVSENDLVLKAIMEQFQE
ncbi:hypothetical protein COY16_02645 [Candidatus Roizmanbacteria bacterium CG_4_10_14_0_2_um_filter_39_13]|uniref:ATP synthase F1 complex delta/epsilon subunit N-terminal domain-containing protein n=1 Tax=Candidatus Roizmanbacteria bacterium CG_4_10_14_0_2_um_filter_39_13 TaxID=1974825 RepID=A0A2M7TZD0_9BACT|nr:MAG: hypothetical protein COY16_02645 [Candidatus Roizmanbacteria bacterium CG_4_10_14_0_2_um_filter_39_13]